MTLQFDFEGIDGVQAMGFSVSLFELKQSNGRIAKLLAEDGLRAFVMRNEKVLQEGHGLIFKMSEGTWQVTVSA